MGRVGRSWGQRDQTENCLRITREICRLQWTGNSSRAILETKWTKFACRVS